jgi:hypothetical protein
MWYPRKFILLALLISEGIFAGEHTKIISSDAAFCSSLIKVLPMQENVIAADEKSEILLISPSGRVLNSTGGFGNGRESIGKLSDIASFSGMKIYGVDFDRGRVLSYDFYLNLKGSFSNNSNWPADFQFFQPLFMQVAQTGEWFIADYAEQKLLKYDIHGEPLFSRYYAMGGEEEYFQDIRGLHINPELRHLYLYDAHLEKIFILDYWGNYLGEKENISGSVIIFSYGAAAYYYAGNKVVNIEGVSREKKFGAALIRVPGKIRHIAGDEVQKSLLVLSEKILIKIYFD